MRETGYYWVKYKGEWVISEYYDTFIINGSYDRYQWALEDLNYKDSDFDQINETRIVNPDESAICPPVKHQ